MLKNYLPPKIPLDPNFTFIAGAVAAGKFVLDPEIRL